MKTLTRVENYKAWRLNRTAAYREQLYQRPELKQIFLELTLKCNEHCFHCGSRCGAAQKDGLTAADYRRLVDDIKRDFGTKGIQFNITGGEPMLRPDFFEIVSYIHEQGFHWGMTTNGTLITPEAARRLKDAGLGTVSISIDGLEETHDRQRGLRGGYRMAMEGIRNLINEDFLYALQVTTVLNHSTMDQIDELYDIFSNMDIDSWRVIGIEPIGRALECPGLLLTAQDQRRLFSFIKEKREQKMPVCYGCSHFLGLEYEGDVRDWYYLCIAGLQVASIDVDGDIRACLDIEKSPETVQGNIFRDSFADVWFNRFVMFRKRLSLRNENCSKCEYDGWCAGGAHHSWDYDADKPLICMKNVLFDVE